MFGLLLLANALPIILYLNYHFENKHTDFNIDEDLHLISITQKGLIKTYNFKDVKKSKYHIAYNYKNTIDNKGRYSLFFSDFGYWDLEFNNGDRYYLSNLFKDFVHDAPVIRKTKYRFRFFPYIKKHDSKEGVRLKSIPKKY